MKNFKPTLSSPQGRTLLYLSIFIVGSALHELLFRLIQPTVWSASALTVTLSTVGLFTLVGAFASERHVTSRITSAATLFVLSFIALKVGYSAVPVAYLLVLALGIATLGAQNIFHRNIKNGRQIVLHGSITALVAVAMVFIFVSGVTALDRNALQQQYDSGIN